MVIFVLSSVLGILVIHASGSSLTSHRGDNCGPGMYYDPAIGRCDTCNVLCDFADIQGTADECRTRCPDYNSKTSTSQPYDSTSTVKSPQAVEDDRQLSSLSPSSSSKHILTETQTILILIITLCVVTVALSAVIIILILWKIRGDRKDIHRNMNFTPTPIYKKGHIQHMNGESCVSAVLLSRDDMDV